MKVSYNWLSQYVDINDINPYDLADKLTLAGVVVDVVQELGENLQDVVVGYVVNRENHPNAEKLSLCKVDIGDGEIHQIICGASNVNTGQKVPVAKLGAKLPNGLKIKEVKLRGIESSGMICSAEELGLNKKLLSKEKTEGILILNSDAIVGEDVKELLDLNDYIFELDLTPNRSDCLSLIGVAYEVAAILDKEIKIPKDNLGVKISNDNKINIQITAPEACKHYSARLLTDVKVAESPYWLQNRLITSGIRPINNLVDITNYVLLEYGQPLHAFDYNYLEKSFIEVRLAKPNEKIITLDDQIRELDEEMLLITDQVKPIALAGVMGGANSEVTSETTQVLLESAFFNRTFIGKTARKLGLRSEASLRFEKGVDPNRIYSALNRATELLVELADAKVVGDIYEDKVLSPKEKEIMINPNKVNKLLGTQLQANDMKDIFRRLRFQVKDQNDSLMISIPSRRNDIEIEVDLVEEVARIYGYDNIPITFPSSIYTQGGLTDKQKLYRKIKKYLQSSGLQEVITYTLTSSKKREAVKGLHEQSNPIKLLTPLSEEREYLRTELLPNLLEVAQYNANRQNLDIRIFEIGTIFTKNMEKQTDLPDEKLIVAGLFTGALPKYWQGPFKPIDFYYVKGILEELFSELGLKDVNYSVSAIEGYHEGRTAIITVDGKKIGHIGQIHPELQYQYDLINVYVFELDFNLLLEVTNTNIEYKQSPKYPAVQRDIALVVSEEIETKNIMNTIKESVNELLEGLLLFDVYTGEQVGIGKKSLAFSLTFRSNERTLTDEEVTQINNKIINKLIEKYQVELRK